MHYLLPPAEPIDAIKKICMLCPTSIQKQYEDAAGDDLKVLIAGAGIAGISAAQMLRKDGRHPVLVERNPDDSHPGYMLALMPMADALIDDLDARTEYRQRSEPFNRYGLYSHKGKLLRVDSMSDILSRYGDYRGIARGKLLGVLTHDGCPTTFSTTVSAITSTENNVQVVLQTGDAVTEMMFDLVIIADGIHSDTRKLVLGDRPVDIADTKWGGWVVWAPEDGNMDLGEELWGAGFFAGVYPVKGQLGVFLGGARKDTKAGPAAFVDSIRNKLNTISPRFESCLQAVTKTVNPYYWSLTDCRSPQWAFGRTILLGDAAAGFLPTAGIGAGMAMESAWVLTHMLRHARPQNLASLLRAYEQSQRPRVEAAQDTSRQLAKMMFHQSRLLAILRETLMRVVSIKVALRPIQKLVAGKPDPEAIVKTLIH